MLAEPRRKQKISVDPQNVRWRNGDTIGKKLLSKMGWTDGKGIGRNEQGASENIKLKPNYRSAGLGADHKTRQHDQWIACHDDFAALLKQLNQGKSGSGNEEEQPEKGETISIQSVSKSSKKRIHYKFTRGKDLSLASERDKNAIFGNRKDKSTEEMSRKQKKDVENDEEITVNKEHFTEKSISASDYYAEKMKKWGNLFKKRSDEEVVEEVITESDNEEKRKKKKKNKRKIKEEHEEEELVEEQEESKRDKKRKKKEVF
uniref:G-patch domain-containing protein n=1 Tax=Bursaphelenchus xylophilus TaxID=6326 RepID=A0A1I7S747_BURXY